VFLALLGIVIAKFQEGFNAEDGMDIMVKEILVQYCPQMPLVFVGIIGLVLILGRDKDD
jgi:hypothetical protein